MKKILLLLILSLAFATCAVADEITFSFILGAPGSLDASVKGLTAGEAMNIVVSDATTGVEFPLLGIFTASTGPATAFVVHPGVVVADYSASGPNTVLIVDLADKPLVAGSMGDNGAFVSGFPDGAGAFLSDFDVTFVSPSVLAMFGFGPKSFLPGGSVSLTSANDNFDGTAVIGQLGGGTVTVETVPEPATWSLLVLGTGLLGIQRIRRGA